MNSFFIKFLSYMNVVASAPEGLEEYLAKEIANLGGFNINT